jgi:hypothetical protein
VFFWELVEMHVAGALVHHLQQYKRAETQAGHGLFSVQTCCCCIAPATRLCDLLHEHTCYHMVHLHVCLQHMLMLRQGRTCTFFSQALLLHAHVLMLLLILYPVQPSCSHQGRTARSSPMRCWCTHSACLLVLQPQMLSHQRSAQQTER